EVMPLGADKRVVVDVRVVAATNQPVEELVSTGKFRRDLYARLGGYVVRLPPLRARMEDIGLLVAALLHRLQPDGAPRRLSRAAARALFLYSWPFHVRELDQVLRSAIAVAAGAEIGVDDLRLGARDVDNASASPDAHGRERLILLLQKHAGNLSAIARDMATSRSQVT